MGDPSDDAEEARDRSKTSHIDKPLGEALRLERDAHRLTRAGLAEMLDISESSLQKYEEGRVRISASRLWQICNMLNVDAVQFFARLPHHVEARVGMSVKEDFRPFIRDDGRNRKASAVARAAAKLPPERLDIALDLVKALRPKPKPDV